LVPRQRHGLAIPVPLSRHDRESPAPSGDADLAFARSHLRL